MAATCGWFVKDGPKNRLAEQDVEKLKLPSYPKERDAWAAFLVQNRATFESAWAQDRLGREWVETMAGIPADGLLPPPTNTGGIMSFEPLRTTSQIRWGIAQLQLADGQADEAARTLIPLLRATYHLQRSAPSLVNQMIAVVILQGTYERLDLVLASDRVSPEVRSALAVALRECPGTDQPIANAFYGEKWLAWGVSEGLWQPTRNLVDWQGVQAHVPWMGWPGIWRMYFNPHRTERMYLKFLDDACVRAQRRQFTAASDVCTPPRRSPLPIKNPCGATFADLVTPTFDKVFEHFWKVEEHRVALLRRLS